MPQRWRWVNMCIGGGVNPGGGGERHNISFGGCAAWLLPYLEVSTFEKPLHSTPICPPHTTPISAQHNHLPPLPLLFRICTTPSLPGITPSGLCASRSWSQRTRRSEAGGGRQGMRECGWEDRGTMRVGRRNLRSKGIHPFPRLTSPRGFT